MDFKFAFGIFSVIASVVQYVPYIKDVLTYTTKPHAFSWFVWGLPCGIIFAAQLVKGGGDGSWATGATTLFCTIIFILSLFHGEKDITRLDILCLALALLAIALWVVTKDPLASVVLVTIADVLGFVPTIRKSIANPYEETMSAYWMGTIKWILSLFALDAFSTTTLLYPLAMIVATGGVAGILAYQRGRTT